MAVRWEKIDRNPVKGIKFFKEKSVERYLEQHEITALLEACDLTTNRTLKFMVITALNTGMRLREIFNLRVIDLDFRNAMINLEHTKNGDRGKVPMTDALREILSDYLAARNINSDFVFCRDDGKPFSDIRYAFKSALDKAGIENFRFHDLRHTFASHLALNGVDLYTIQKLGRWETVSMVMKYAHLSPQHQQRAINVLSGMTKNKDNSRTKLKSGRIVQFDDSAQALDMVGAGGGN